MRIKKTLLFIIAFISAIGICIPKISYADVDKIYVGGFPAGFSLYTRGAYVMGVCDVVTADGPVSPCKKADLRAGDTILYIDNNETNNAADIEKSVTDDKSKNVIIKREDEIINLSVIPAKDINGNFRLGVFIRDAVNGIGTVTYMQGNRFAALGHPVLDENGNILEITGGSLFSCNITGYVRGERGKPGELHGVFTKRKRIATIEKNTDKGVYGVVTEEWFDAITLTEIEIGQAKSGDATIRTTIEGDEPKEYKISIIKVDNKAECKNIVIKITDRALLERTGGIVQGMSGSPIIQNGVLVGSVTHVFINDPTRGFGLTIDNMINN